MSCKHEHGDTVKALSTWVCGQCWSIIGDRPKRYGPLGLTRLPNDSVRVGGRQEIVWQASVLTSAEGTTLNTYLKAIARRFQHRDKTLTDYEAHKLAIEEARAIGEPFGHPDYDWSRMGAIDVADEAMTYWDCDDATESNA